MASIWCNLPRNFSSLLFFFDISKKEAQTQTTTLLSSLSLSLSHEVHNCDFTWDDVVRFSPPQHTSDSSYLQGFFEIRNAEKPCEFVPFVVEEQIVGYVHNGFAHYLRRFEDTFTFPEYTSYDLNFGYHMGLHSRLSAYKDRTKAVGDVIKCFGEELIPGIRNEVFGMCYHCMDMQKHVYGVQMNGYVERDGKKYLWLAKRNKVKPTFPGKLYNMVAGGQPHGISCGENLVKECKEEAGIPRSISSTATAAVSYLDIDGYRLKRDILFCYDLKVPEAFIPTNEGEAIKIRSSGLKADEEVESLKLIPATQVANIIRCTDFFKANCNLVVIDFLFRHGYILSLKM